ncbi:MAG: hypothetical protein A2169_08785 [Deltaproteobacteria bacterium RBG_13_47_9]|nr:MAG: hypothetical protein A2169_08785 [Deltaproteobacteria bacterium RBG_13_47_9]
MFDGEENLKNLPGLCQELLAEQKKRWQDLREGVESLKGVRERDISCSRFSVRLQHNPKRIKSSLTGVGDKNGKQRKCFLCLNHLPEDQKGILYRGKYLILCNPMPIFPSHFTVSHLDHRLQSIVQHTHTLFQLMDDFGSGWKILYNGPKCGASAPDHLHFQVVPSGQMPIEKDIREEKRLTLMKQTDGILFYGVKDLGREVILIEGDDLTALEFSFKGYLNGLRKILLIDEEPMINVVGFHEETKRRLVIFPRRKHRPDAFFKEEEARILVSPGVIDMGGVLITPVEKDFERLDGASVEGIFKEVSSDPETVKRAINAI